MSNETPAETIRRLQAELEQAQHWANTMEHERDWERDVVHSDLLARAEAAEARLAKVPALVDTLRYFAAEPRYSHGERLGLLPKQHEAREALAAWDAE